MRGWGDDPAWQDASMAEIEALVGSPLRELPLHGELHGRVLALGGGLMEEIVRPLFEALPVASPLPAAQPSAMPAL